MKSKCLLLICCTCRENEVKAESTYILGQDQVGLEVPVGILGLRDPVGEGPVGLVPVDAHVAGGVVYQVVDVVPQLSGASSARCKSM